MAVLLGLATPRSCPTTEYDATSGLDFALFFTDDEEGNKVCGRTERASMESQRPPPNKPH